MEDIKLSKLSKKTISVRLNEDTYSDVEKFAKKYNMSIGMSVAFLMSVTLEDIKNGKTKIEQRTIAEG